MEIKIHEHGYWIGYELSQHRFDKDLAECIYKLFRMYNITSVVDIGCGDGSYVKFFLDKDFICYGYDGNPDTETITAGLCCTKDFSQLVDIGLYPGVLSLEVGEHIPMQYENNFIDNLVKTCGTMLVLSWAVEGQGGFGHSNCRNNDYIITRLENKGFRYMSYLTTFLRLNAKISWFKNTLMVFVKK